MTSLTKFPVTQLTGVGKATATRLAALNIHTVYDVLLHFPHSYQDRSHVVPIAHTQLGQTAVVEGTIVQTQVQFAKRRSLLCTLEDETGRIVLRFFHFNSMQQKYSLHEGARLRCFGEVRVHQHQKHMIHPEYHTVKSEKPLEHQDCYTPVYPTTVGVGQAVWRNLTAHALDMLSEYEDTLRHSIVETLFQKYDLPDLVSAIRLLHRPPLDVDLLLLTNYQHPAQQRFVFAELLAHHLHMRQVRLSLQQEHAVPLTQTTLHDPLVKVLPFQLTQAQQRAITIISDELSKPQPMMRLLQGDVGAGKTLVALFALLQAVASQQQAVLMAPTELLAQQHASTLGKLCDPLGVNVMCLTGQLSATIRREYLAQIEKGNASIVVGTHALFQKDVTIPKLAFIVIDEQHRFGVNQRLALRDKGKHAGCVPHQLVMTATPIPRTLAMTFYADLAYSVLDELPPGRTPVTTVAVPNTRRDEVIIRIQDRCQSKQQVYWVCTLVEDSEVLQCEAAESTAKYLQAQLPQLTVSLVHGRTKTEEKQALMQRFKQGEIDLLVATTVIEVGVDVPNASLMIIENSERLGLSQLHQLRGRVGRGTQQSHCVLLYQAPLTPMAHERLAVLRDTQDGFVIAEKDLALRGPGDLLGTRQAGLMQFRFADLVRDQHLLSKVQMAADQILNEHPERATQFLTQFFPNQTDRVLA